MRFTASLDKTIVKSVLVGIIPFVATWAFCMDCRTNTDGFW